MNELLLMISCYDHVQDFLTIKELNIFNQQILKFSQVNQIIVNNEVKSVVAENYYSIEEIKEIIAVLEQWVEVVAW